MLYDLAGRKSLVSEEFNQMCVAARVEARVTPYPNPGNPMRAMRKITIKNFGTGSVKVTQFNKKQTTHIIPPKGSIDDILLLPDEALPKIELENA